MTKQELLEIMSRHGACSEATDHVACHASGAAAEILATCDRLEWLTWLMGRELRLVRFVRVCAKRAAAHANAADAAANANAAYAAGAAAYAAAYSADAAANANAANAAGAAYAAAYAADAAANANAAANAAGAAAAAHANAADAAASAAYAAERKAQLIGLRRIGRDWANGLPAEV